MKHRCKLSSCDIKIGKYALRDLFSMSKDRWVSFFGTLVQKNGAHPCFDLKLSSLLSSVFVSAVDQPTGSQQLSEHRPVQTWSQGGSDMRSRGYPGIFPPLQVRCSTGNCLTLCVFHKNCSHLNSTFPNRLSLPECQFKILEADRGIISKSHYIHNIITQTILWTCSMASAFLILSLYFVPWHWTPIVLLSWGWQKQCMMEERPHEPLL